MTILHTAILNTDLEAIRILSKHPSFPLLINKNNNSWKKSPIHLAVESGNVNLLKYLVQKGGDLNMADSVSCTSLTSPSEFFQFSSYCCCSWRQRHHRIPNLEKAVPDQPQNQARCNPSRSSNPSKELSRNHQDVL